MEPDIDDLHNLIRDQAAASGDAAATLSRFGDRASAEGRALELAISAIEVLRDRGAISGADVCRLAVLLGYQNDAVSRAWNTRAEFDLGKQRYAFDAPIARVVKLP